MNYWILALPPDDMEHCIKIGTFGLARKHNMGKVKAGDKVVCYTAKEYKIIALGETTSDYYMDIKKIFKSEGDFPDRFDFKAVRLLREECIDFKSLIDDLKFITNKLYWSVYLRSGIAQISKEDWDLIESKARVAGIRER